jgi:sulfatase maturation enzyme AslB (radical SAM superfamily)
MNKNVFDEVLKEAIDETLPNELISFSLFGGEPLLNKELFRHILNKTSKIKDRQIEINITTNLSLIDEETLSIIKKYEKLLTIGVSIDGPKEVYKKNKTGNFETILNNYKKIKNTTEAKLSASVVWDYEYVDELFNNIKYLFGIGFRRFNILYNLESDKLFESKSNIDLFLKELEKLKSFHLENIDEIKRMKVEKQSLEVPGRIDPLLCKREDLEYVGVEGDRFNCPRYKYFKENEKHPNINWDKCSKCKFEPYCCSCWGNNSYLNPSIKKQENYCYLIRRSMGKIINHWEEVKRMKKDTNIMEINKREETMTLLLNPKKVDLLGEKIMVMVDNFGDLEIEDGVDYEVGILINKNNINKITKIIKKFIPNKKYFFFEFEDLGEWSEEDLDNYEKELSKIIKLNEKIMFKISPIDDILLRKDNILNIDYVKGDYYYDINLNYNQNEISDSFKKDELVPICSDCNFSHCHFNPLYNKEITNEEIIPPYQQCEKAKIEGKAALKFYDKFIN